MAVRGAGHSARRDALDRVRVVVFAGDHGVARTAATSAYPPEVTAQMVLNFLAGGAAVNVLARQNGASVRVVDIAVDVDYADLGATVPDDVVARQGAPRHRAPSTARTRSRATRPRRAFALGVAHRRRGGRRRRRPARARRHGHRQHHAGRRPHRAARRRRRRADVVGRGTGIDDATWMRKTAAVRDAMRRGRPFKGDPIGLLATVGGADIAAMTGLPPRRRRTAYAGAARRRRLVRGGARRAAHRLPRPRVVARRAPVDRARRSARRSSASTSSRSSTTACVSARARGALVALPGALAPPARRCARWPPSTRPASRDREALMPDSLRLALGHAHRDPRPAAAHRRPAHRRPRRDAARTARRVCSSACVAALGAGRASASSPRTCARPTSASTCSARSLALGVARPAHPRPAPRRPGRHRSTASG